MQQRVSPQVRWEWIGEGWKMFTDQWLTWVLMQLVFFLIVSVVMAPFLLIIFAVASSMSDSGGGTAIIILLYPVMYLAIILVSTWLLSGLYGAAFRQLRGGQLAIGDLFSGTPYFLRVLGASLLMGIMIGIGGALCVIPGLIVAGLVFFTIPLVVEGNQGPIDAIRNSIELTKQEWLMFAVFAFVLGLLAQAGAILCGVGALATFPLLFLTHAVAYRDCVGVSGARGFTPAMPPPPPQYGAQPQYGVSQQPPPQYGAPQPPSPQYGAPQPPPPQNYGMPPQSYGAPQPPPPQPPQANQPRSCPNCRAQVSPTSKFCPHCGTVMGQ